MIKRSLSLSILFVLLFRVSVYASQINNIDTSAVVIGQEWRSLENTAGRVFFLFSRAELAKLHQGHIVLFKSSCEIAAEVRGNVYALFSEVKIHEAGGVTGKVYTLSSLVEYLQEAIAEISPMAFWESRLFQEEDQAGGKIYDSRLPAVVFFFLFCLFRQVLCLVIYGIKPGFFNQGSALLEEDGQDVVQFGLIAYALIIAAAFIFLISVVGVIFTFLILAISFVLIILGQISLEISLGDLILSRVGARSGAYQSMVVGGLIFESTVFIPMVGFTANFLFLPILCLGMLATNFINGFYRRKYYETPFDSKEETNNRTDTEKIRDIIIGK